LPENGLYTQFNHRKADGVFTTQRLFRNSTKNWQRCHSDASSRFVNPNFSVSFTLTQTGALSIPVFL